MFNHVGSIQIIYRLCHKPQLSKHVKDGGAREDGEEFYFAFTHTQTVSGIRRSSSYLTENVLVSLWRTFNTLRTGDADLRF